MGSLGVGAFRHSLRAGGLRFSLRFDLDARVFVDSSHSEGENREIPVGYSMDGRLLLVPL